MLADMDLIWDMQDAYGISAWALLICAIGAVLAYQLLGCMLWRLVWCKVKEAVILPPLMILFFQQVLGMGGGHADSVGFGMR
ncbi:hypothetical protein V8Z74_06080 [Comamonas sp. w2-DMI]|uniref:hypothetical protein n=1 Tax=Comamonas sp. w2-DMI TaxID=3126391 RepID=UPI0032E4183C